MENSKNVFLAIALCAAVFLLWERFYFKDLPQHPNWNQNQIARVESKPKAPAPSTMRMKAAAPVTTLKKQALDADTTARATTTDRHAKVITIGPEGYRVSINTHGGVVSGVNLGQYRGRGTGNVSTLIAGPGQLQINATPDEWSYLSSVNYTVQSVGKDSAGNDRVVLSYDDKNVTIQRTYTLHPKIYSVDQENSFKFKNLAPGFLYVDLAAEAKVPKSKAENERRYIMYSVVGSGVKSESTEVKKVENQTGEMRWVGVSSRYFLNAALDMSPAMHPQFQDRPLNDGNFAASLVYRVQGSVMNIPLRYYYGPKDIDILKEVGSHLDAAVDFGWFTIFAYPILEALKWLDKVVHNYGVAIILLTILMKLATYPLTFKSMKSMKEMQRIQPQLAKLREKYKGNKEQLNKEMLQLMKANGYNPAAGCLPIAIQMPIFFALYRVLYGAIDLYGQPFFGWIHDLSAKDPYYVTPVLMAIMMFIQQKMTPNTATDPAQQRMMLLMPVVFGVMMFWLPSGLTLYMLVNSVISIIQQLFVNRSMAATQGARPAAA